MFIITGTQHSTVLLVIATSTILVGSDEFQHDIYLHHNHKDRSKIYTIHLLHYINFWPSVPKRDTIYHSPNAKAIVAIL